MKTCSKCSSYKLAMGLFKPKTVLNSLWPSLTLTWVFGAHIGVKRAWRITYAITMTVIAVYVNVYSATLDTKFENSMINYFVKFLNYLKMTGSLILIWLWELRGISAVTSSILELTKLDEELKNFGLKVNHNTFFWKQLVIIGGFVVLVSSVRVLKQPFVIDTYGSQMSSGGFVAYLSISLSTHMQPIQSVVADLLFVMMLEAFRRRFKLVNKIFKGIGGSEDRMKVKVFSTSHSNATDVSDKKFQERNANRHLSLHLVMERVDRACRIHKRLLKVAQDLADAFSLHLCVDYSTSLPYIVMDAFNLISSLTDEETDTFRIYTMILSAILAVSRFLQIVVSCSNTTDEATRLGTSLYRVPIDDAEVHDQLQEHSIYIVQRKLKFTAFGIAEINCDWAKSVFSTVIKYMIVLLQLRGND